MKTINDLFLAVAYNNRPVSDLIKSLTDEKSNNKIDEEDKNAYQAFCCALLAKQSNNIMQKGQYIQEYNIFIQKSLMINSDSIIGRLIRLMVESQLQNVSFIDHMDEDKQFLLNKVESLNDDELVNLINKITKK